MVQKHPEQKYMQALIQEVIVIDIFVDSDIIYWKPIVFTGITYWCMASIIQKLSMC